jgi:hypothetical protein
MQSNCTAGVASALLISTIRVIWKVCVRFEDALVIAAVSSGACQSV